MESTCLFSAIAGNQKVDSESGVISGCSVITVGECAGKHQGTWVDSITLEKLLALAIQFKDGVKVKLSQNTEHDGSVGQIIGSLKSFRIDGNHLRADLHLLKTDENYDKILEMSAKMPECFGLSIVVPQKYEKQGNKQFLRPTDIFSVDLVEEPAANKTGLFSAKESMSDKIKYAADGKTHEKDCECKECMSKHSKKSMSEMLCDVLGLSESDTPETIKTKLAAFAPKPTDTTADVATLSAKVTAIETAANQVALSAKKTEIAGLVAEATRDGKVIPLTDEELAGMPIPTIKAMFSKLVPNQVKLSGRREIAPPKSANGEVIKFKDSDERAEFCRSKLAEGAAKLTDEFIANPTLGLSRN